MIFDPASFVRSGNHYSEIEISALNSAQIDEWKKAGIVLLLGSYISTFFPSNLPTGGESVQALWSAIFSENMQSGRSWPKWLCKNFARLPFEVVMQNCPDEQGIRRSIQRIFGVASPNPLHEFVADQLKRDVVHSIITTNYDLCFDAVLQDSKELRIIWDEQSWKINRSILAKTGKTYWKIHGSAHAGALESLVFDQQGERQMDSWKQTLLRDLVNDKTLVVLGYSGSDFDICPQLASDVQPKHVVWLQPNRDVTLNAKRVLAQQKGTLVIGDLDIFLTALFGMHSLPRAGSGTLKWSINPAAVAHWRVKVLNAMGCGEFMLEELENFSESPATMELRSAAYANIGRYYDAVVERERKLADPALDLQSKLQCELEIASSKFIYGSHIRGWREASRTEKKIRAAGMANLLTNVAEIKLMMAMRLGQIAERTGTESLFTGIRQKAARLYQEVGSTLAGKGHWGRLHGLRLTAQRLGIVSADDGRELTLPALESYLSVGYTVMVCISIRDAVRSSGPWRLSVQKKNACLWAIKTARRYHWKHEEWKFRWLLLIRGGGRFRWRHFRAWRQAFKDTQYTWTGQLMQIVFNSAYRNRVRSI